jgi:predicted Zn-dependent peptidase
VFQIFVELEGGRSAMQKSLERIDAELTALATNPPTEREVTLARNVRRRSLLFGSESLASTATWLSQWSMPNDEASPSTVEELLRRDEGIEPRRLQEVAAQHLPTDSRLVIFVNHWHNASPSGGVLSDEVRP